MWPFRPRQQEDAPLGRRGERLARKFLSRRGMTILASNYRCPSGEADLIALDPVDRSGDGRSDRHLVFIEVKTRSPGQLTDPISAVNADKQQRLRRVAQYYLATHDAGDLCVRFDVVSIVGQAKSEADITHYPGAFQ